MGWRGKIGLAMHKQPSHSERRPGRSDRVGTRVRGAATWETILDQADVLFAERGFDSVSTNEIAAACNISVGTLYHYVSNKQEIALALAERYEARLGDLLLDLTEPEGGSFAEQVSRCVRAMGDFAARNPAIADLLEGKGPGAADARRRIRKMLVACGRTLIAHRTTSLGEHEREITAHVCASVFVAVMHAATECTGDREDLASLIQEHATLLIAYLQERLPSP